MSRVRSNCFHMTYAHQMKLMVLKYRMIFKCIVCSFQLGQADRFAYKLVNLARCIYYCSIFRFELKFYSLCLNVQTVINTSWNINKVVWKMIRLAKLKETDYSNMLKTYDITVFKNQECSADRYNNFLTNFSRNYKLFVFQKCRVQEYPPFHKMKSL